MQQLASSQVSPEIPINENFESLEVASMFGKRHPAVTGLTWAGYGGQYNGNLVADWTVTLTDNSTNYVVVHRSTGVVSVSTATTNWNSSAYARVFKLTTVAGAVTAEVDSRLDTNGLYNPNAGSGTAGTLDFDTDGTLAANSDAKIATQKATKTYVDGKVAGLSWKAAVRAASTANGTLATAFANGQTTDGVTLATGDRILLKNQSAPAENGIRIVAASGAPARATDADSSAELVDASVLVSEGTTNADTQWVCSTNAPITVDTTALTWVQFNVAATFTGGTLTSALNEAPTVTIASAGTVNIGAAAANSISITGTTTITAFDSIAAGVRRLLVFAGALTLTHNGTSLILPGAANITTAAGDAAAFLSLGSGNWRLIGYMRAAGLPALGTAGKHAIPIMAASMRPSVSGGCAALAALASAANQPDIVTLDFDASTEEFAQFAIPMPKSWNEGTVTALFIWSHAATATNFGVVWSIQGLAVSDNEGIAQAFGTQQNVTDTGGTTNNIYQSAETSAVTIAGSPAAGDVVFIRVFRKAADGSDTMTIDARLHGIVLFITTDAENDA